MGSKVSMIQQKVAEQEEIDMIRVIKRRGTRDFIGEESK